MASNISDNPPTVIPCTDDYRLPRRVVTLQQRRAAWKPPAPHAQRGYVKLYTEHVLQADRGADFDFLVGKTGAPVPRDNH